MRRDQAKPIVDRDQSVLGGWRLLFVVEPALDVAGGPWDVSPERTPGAADRTGSIAAIKCPAWFERMRNLVDPLAVVTGGLLEPSPGALRRLLLRAVLFRAVCSD